MRERSIDPLAAEAFGLQAPALCKPRMASRIGTRAPGVPHAREVGVRSAP